MCNRAIKPGFHEIDAIVAVEFFSVSVIAILVIVTIANKVVSIINLRSLVAFFGDHNDCRHYMETRLNLYVVQLLNYF